MPSPRVETANRRAAVRAERGRRERARRELERRSERLLASRRPRCTAVPSAAAVTSVRPSRENSAERDAPGVALELTADRLPGRPSRRAAPGRRTARRRAARRPARTRRSRGVARAELLDEPARAHVAYVGAQPTRRGGDQLAVRAERDRAERAPAAEGGERPRAHVPDAERPRQKRAGRVGLRGGEQLAVGGEGEGGGVGLASPRARPPAPASARSTA